MNFGTLSKQYMRSHVPTKLMDKWSKQVGQPWCKGDKRYILCIEKERIQPCVKSYISTSNL